MANICLLPEKIDEFKKALKDKEISLSDLLNLDHADLVKKLEPYAGVNAKEVATMIEEKLILKNRMLGLQNALSKMTASGKYDPTKIAEDKKILSDYRAKQQERIFSPKENEAFLGGIAEKKLGIEVTREESQKVFDLSTQIHDLKEKAKSDLLGTNAELEKKQQELGEYLNSLNEKPAWKSIRDSLASVYKNLFIGIKTGVKTATLGTLNSGIELVNRRVGAMKVIGDVDLSLKAKAASENIKLFSQTGSNSFLKTSLEDNSVFGSNNKGYSENFGGKDTIAPGNKILTTTAKGINLASRGLKYFTINILHKLPMLVNSSLNFVDALDITASQIAKTDFAKEKGMDANAIFTDALKVEPETELGIIARERSQQDAFRVLNINNTPLSEATTGLQRIINKNVPTLGDYIIPMAKVPSSVIYNQLENFGVGLGTGLYDVVKGVGELNDLKKTGSESSEDGVKATMKIRSGINTMIRVLGVVATAALLTAKLKPKDFYSDVYGNSYVRMGNYWLSTEVFGGASTAVSGSMMGKENKSGYIFDYAKAGFYSLGQAPIANSLTSFVQKGEQGKISSAFVNSYLNPILLQDIKKSEQQKSITPVLVGTLIRTEQQKIADDKASAAKSAATRKANAAAKAKAKK